MPPYRKEISDWRKRAACVTCRKSKIRCEFTSAQAVACKPCMRKGITCVMPKSVRGRALGTGEEDEEEKEIPVNKNAKRLFAWLSTRDDVATKAEAEEMASQLEMVIRQARLQIDGLKNRYGISPETLTLDGLKLDSTVHSPVAWDLSLVQSPDCLRTAIDQGMLTAQEAQEAFHGFMEEMRVYLPFDIPEDMPFQEWCQKWPLFTLTMVVCYMFCSMAPGSDSTRVDKLVIFLEQVVQEWLYHRQSQGVEVIKSLLLMASYLLPAPQPKIPMYIAMAITCSYSIELGSDQDIEAFRKNPEDDVLRDRIRTYACIALITLGVTSRDSQIHILAVVPRIKPIREALFHCGSKVDRLVGSYCILHEIGRTALVDARRCCENKPVHEIAAFFNRMRSELDSLIVQTAAVTENFWDSDEVRKPMVVAQLAFHIVAGEAAMNFMLFNNATQPAATIEDVRPIAMDLVAASQQTIDMFLENATTRPKMPLWLFFRPLRAIAVLLRLRIVFWSIGFQYDGLQVELYYNRVRESWTKLRTNDAMGLKLYDALTLVERWLSIKLLHDDKDQSMAHTADKLFAFVRDAILTQSREGLTKVVEKDLLDSMNSDEVQPSVRYPAYPDHFNAPGPPGPPPGPPPLEGPQNPQAVEVAPPSKSWPEPSVVENINSFTAPPLQLEIPPASTSDGADPIVSLDSLGLDMQHFESAGDLLKHLFSGDL